MLQAKNSKSCLKVLRPMTNKPAEAVITGAAVGLVHAGITRAMFIPEAPLAACRLCGAVYQTKLHRLLHSDRLNGKLDENNQRLLALVLELGTIWREQHTKLVHTEDEVVNFTKTGWAFTPQAAKVLAPFGIIPMGMVSEEHAQAMLEAPRAPDLTYLQGGE